MTSSMQPLRDEHSHLFPRIEELRRAADKVGYVPVDELTHLVDDAHEFLDGHLLPHALAEERVLYPAVARVLGSPRATATMSRDHAAVAELARELAALRGEVLEGEMSTDLVHSLRSVLYGLYHLLAVHFSKEEEVYVPILEGGLTDAEVEALFGDMHAAAEDVRTTAHA